MGGVTFVHCAISKISEHLGGGGVRLIVHVNIKYFYRELKARRESIGSQEPLLSNKTRSNIFKLDWANSAPTSPQAGHHSRHRF